MNTYLTFTINPVKCITSRLTPQYYKTIGSSSVPSSSVRTTTKSSYKTRSLVINGFFLLFTIVSETLRYVHTGGANCERFIIRLFKLKFMETEKKCQRKKEATRRRRRRNELQVGKSLSLYIRIALKPFNRT